MRRSSDLGRVIWRGGNLDSILWIKNLKKATRGIIFWLRRRASDELAKTHRRRDIPRRASPLPKYSVLKAPIEFDIGKSAPRSLTVSFFERLRELISSGTRRVWIDFSDTRKFVSSGTLLLKAELTRLLESIPDLRIRSTLPINNKAAQVLHQVGISNQLKTKNPTRCVDRDVVNWRSARGQGALGEKYDEILGFYDGIIAEPLQNELYTGITEAMTNAHQHAYIAPRGDGVTTPPDYRPWWMFSQEKDGKLSVVFCDLGVGIAASLPHTRPRLWKLMAHLGIGQGRQIEGAVRDSKTRTKKHHRGKGLRQIIETISSCDGGKALILSNKGWYSMESGKQRTGDYSDSIMGTVIFWQMPLLRSGS
jgi:anti-anti-sigma regulatory factor